MSGVHLRNGPGPCTKWGISAAGRVTAPGLVLCARHPRWRSLSLQVRSKYESATHPPARPAANAKAKNQVTLMPRRWLFPGGVGNTRGDADNFRTSGRTSPSGRGRGW